MKKDFEKSEYVFATVRSARGASYSIHCRMREFISEVENVIEQKNKDYFFKVNINGVTGFINKDKSFVMADFYPDYISVLFWTGDSTISGLIKANYDKSHDNSGSERLKIPEAKNSETFKKAVKYAIQAHDIAYYEWAKKNP
jgi:hypothetical protein